MERYVFFDSLADGGKYDLAARLSLPGLFKVKRVLVTGGTGFIGRHAVSELAERGYEVHLVSRNPRETHSSESSVHFHRGDLFDLQQQSILFNQIRPSHLLHFAWYTMPGSYWTSPENITWVRSSLDLLKNFVDNGGRRVVFAGSCAEYDWNYGRCSEDVTPLKPITLYGVCKNALRQIFQEYCDHVNVEGAWGRIFYLYGPHEHPDRLVPSMIRSLLCGERALCSHGDLARDFLHVADVAAAFVAVLESRVRGAVNIASGEPVAIRKVVNHIGTIIGRMDLVDYVSNTNSGSQPPLLAANIERLSQEVRFTPRIGLAQGLEATIQWWKENFTPRPNRR